MKKPDSYADFSNPHAIEHERQQAPAQLKMRSVEDAFASIHEPQRDNLKRSLQRYRKSGDQTMEVSTLETAILNLDPLAQLGARVLEILNARLEKIPERVYLALSGKDVLAEMLGEDDGKAIVGAARSLGLLPEGGQS